MTGDSGSYESTKISILTGSLLPGVGDVWVDIQVIGRLIPFRSHHHCYRPGPKCERRMDLRFAGDLPCWV